MTDDLEDAFKNISIEDGNELANALGIEYNSVVTSKDKIIKCSLPEYHFENTDDDLPNEIDIDVLLSDIKSGKLLSVNVNNCTYFDAQDIISLIEATSDSSVEELQLVRKNV